MPTNSEQHLLKRIQKASRFFIRNKITTEELLDAIWDDFAAFETVVPELIPEICEAIPDPVRCEFRTRLEASTATNFTWRPFLGVRMTAEELQAQRKLHGERIHAWAILLLKHLEEHKT